MDRGTLAVLLVALAVVLGSIISSMNFILRDVDEFANLNDEEREDLLETREMEFAYVGQQKALMKRKTKDLTDDFFAIFNEIKSGKSEASRHLERIDTVLSELNKSKREITDLHDLECDMLRTLRSLASGKFKDRVEKLSKSFLETKEILEVTDKAIENAKRAQLALSTASK